MILSKNSTFQVCWGESLLWSQLAKQLDYAHFINRCFEIFLLPQVFNFSLLLFTTVLVKAPINSCEDHCFPWVSLSSRTRSLMTSKHCSLEHLPLVERYGNWANMENANWPVTYTLNPSAALRAYKIRPSRPFCSTADSLSLTADWCAQSAVN